MDYEKIGKVIYELRTERRLTQKELADELNISDKTVSKWERGAGCPDISLLRELAKYFCVDMEKVLRGSLAENDFVGGNMKKSKFYVCPICGNVTVCTGNAEISCCGRKLEAIEPRKINGEDVTEEEKKAASEEKPSEGEVQKKTEEQEKPMPQAVKQTPLDIKTEEPEIKEEQKQKVLALDTMIF